MWPDRRCRNNRCRNKKMQKRPPGCNWSTVLIPSVVLGFLAATVYVPQIEGQDKALNQLVEMGQQLQAQGRYVEAEAALQSAVDRAAASSEPLVVARTMNDLGAVKHTRGQYSAAAAPTPNATQIS